MVSSGDANRDAAGGLDGGRHNDIPAFDILINADLEDCLPWAQKARFPKIDPLVARAREVQALPVLENQV